MQGVLVQEEAHLRTAGQGLGEDASYNDDNGGGSEEDAQASSSGTAREGVELMVQALEALGEAREQLAQAEAKVQAYARR